MAMTLRLTDDDDAALTALAAAEGVSKQEAALRAIREKSARLDRDSEVRRLTRDAVARYGPLLDRLAQ
ncbi:CopG family transcriptional regulator [Tsukamurella sp. USMM236]|uniref:CopG family transcriptional regulator n=1 Tax=Tsukamurella TaxID=2060 RepID=UPI003019B809